LVIEIALGVLVVSAAALVAHNYSLYPPPVALATPPPSTVFLTPVPFPSQTASDTAAQLVPIDVATVAPAATAASTLQTLPFNAPVRVLRYDGDFLATGAVEGNDGEFYVTYYWDMGSTYYTADRLGVITGSRLREIFAGDFLDQLDIIDNDSGYPEFVDAIGDTVHPSVYYGIWLVSGAGAHRTRQISMSDAALLHRQCTWCGERAAPNAKPYCASFAGGRMCGSDPGVTFTKNGKTVTIDKYAFLVGAGPDRFLIVERPLSQAPRYVEGFAAHLR
jgi:hypothetical protein